MSDNNDKPKRPPLKEPAVWDGSKPDDFGPQTLPGYHYQKDLPRAPRKPKRLPTVKRYGRPKLRREDD